MGMLGKLGERRTRKVGEFLEPHLEDGEQIVAAVPMTGTKHPSWPSAAFYGLALTDSRLFIVSYPRTSETPNDLVAAHPRAGLQVAEWKPGMVSGTLVLEHPEHGSVKLEVPRMHRDDAETFVAAIS